MCAFTQKKTLIILSVLVVLVFLLTGCAPAINKLAGVSKETKSSPDSVPLVQVANSSCVSEYLRGDDLKAAVRQALEDGQVQQLRAELEAQGFTFVPWATRALRVGQRLRVLLTFSPEAVIVYSPDGPTAFSLIPQGEHTSSRQPGKAKLALRAVKGIAKQQILDQLKQSPAFRELKRALEAAGYKLDGRFRAVVDEQGKKLLVALRVAELRSIHYPYTLTAQVQLVGKQVKIDLSSVKISASCGAPVAVPAVNASTQAQPQVSHFLSGEMTEPYGWYDSTYSSPTSTSQQTCTYVYGTTSCTTTNTANYPATLEAYNQGVAAGAYGMLAVDTLAANRGMMLGGFRDVTLSQLEAFETDAIGSSMSSVSSIQFANLALAVSLLQSLTETQVQNWLLQLSQAIQNGTFDTVYDQLLLDAAFRNFRDGVMYLLPPGQATLTATKAAIRRMAETYVAVPSGDLVNRMIDTLTAYFVSLGLPSLVAKSFARAIVSDFVIVWVQLVGGDLQFDSDLTTLVEYLLHKAPTEAGRLLMNLMREFRKYASWGAAFLKTFTQVAANVIRNYPHLNIVDLFRIIKDKTTGREFIVPIVLLGHVPTWSGGHIDATIYLTFDGCTNCAARAQRILDWLNAAVQDLEACGCGIIGYHFFDSGAYGVNEVIQQVRDKFRDKNVAIIITWWEGGQLKFTCIGLLCYEFSSQTLQNLACMQAGLPPGCGAQPSGSPSSNSSPPSTIGPAPHPDDPAYNYCRTPCPV